MTFRELFVRWQVAYKSSQEQLASLISTIDNVGIAIVHAHSGRKGSRPVFRKIEDYLPWKFWDSNHFIRLEGKDFGALKKIVIGE